MAVLPRLWNHTELPRAERQSINRYGDPLPHANNRATASGLSAAVALRVVGYGVAVAASSGKVLGGAMVISPATIVPVNVGLGPKMA